VDYRILLREIDSHTLAGLIFATQPSALANTPMLQARGVARVAIMKPGWESLGVPAISLDDDSFVSKALDYLAARGRKRVALFAAVQDKVRQEAFDAGAASRGLVTKPWWKQPLPVTPPECAAQVAMLLGHPDQGERPDGVVIADDNMVESVTSGLVRVGVRVPDDMEIVGHCNFPWPAPSVVPVQRLGYDSRQTLRACIDVIDAQLRGETPKAIRIPAVFESELQS
jgi:DNA-binding LacI/PurR family transcriptional regulator